MRRTPQQWRAGAACSRSAFQWHELPCDDSGSTGTAHRALRTVGLVSPARCNPPRLNVHKCVPHDTRAYLMVGQVLGAEAEAVGGEAGEWYGTRLARYWCVMGSREQTTLCN